MKNLAKLLVPKFRIKTACIALYLVVNYHLFKCPYFRLYSFEHQLRDLKDHQAKQQVEHAQQRQLIHTLKKRSGVYAWHEQSICFFNKKKY